VGFVQFYLTFGWHQKQMERGKTNFFN